MLLHRSSTIDSLFSQKISWKIIDIFAGRNGRQSYQRTAEQNKTTSDEEKPVMNLFDPCKVPTGRSYFTVIFSAQKTKCCILAINIGEIQKVISCF